MEHGFEKFIFLLQDFGVFHLLTSFLSLRSCVRKPEQKTCVKQKPAEPIEGLGKAPSDGAPPASQHLRCFVVRVLLKYEPRHSLRSNSFSFWIRRSTSRTKITASSKLVTWYELTLVRNNSRPSSEGRRPTSIEIRR
jgi:hypothetical protein